MGGLTESATSELKVASFIHKIKSSTADLHLRLETQELLSAIMSPSVTRLQYFGYLTIMKEIEAVYERRIITRLAGSFPELVHRKASEHILHDLHNVGETGAKEFSIKEFPEPAEEISIPFALGFMYVMEGSKLGGKVIYKHIHRTLGYSEDWGARFIADYGMNTVGLWKVFLSKFSVYIAENDWEEEAIQGAEYAFSSIYDFFESNRLVYEDQRYTQP